MSNPLSVGFHIRVDSVSGKLLQQDGFISAMLLFILLFAVTVGLTLLRFTLAPGFTPHAAMVCLLILMIASTVIMAMLRFSNSSSIKSMYRYRNDTYPRDSSREIMSRSTAQPIGAARQILRTALPLIGIVGFFTLGISIDFLLILAMGHCVRTYVRCDVSNMAHFLLKLMLHVCRLLFSGAAMLFCVFFHNRVFHKSRRSRYALVVIMSGTLSIWFSTLLWQSREALSSSEGYSLNCSLDNPDTRDLHCLHTNSSLFLSAKAASPFLSPLVEFLLLVLNVIGNMFVGMAGDQDNEGRLQTEGNIIDREATSDVHVSQQVSDRMADIFRETEGYLKRLLSRHHGSGTSDSNDSTPNQLTFYTEPFFEIDKLRNMTRPSSEDCEHQLYPLALEIQKQVKDLCRDVDRDVSGHVTAEGTRNGNFHDDDVASNTATDIASLSSPITLLPVLFNLLFIALSAVTYGKPARELATWKPLYMAFKLLYKVVHVVVCLLGFSLSADLEPLQRDFSGLEFTLMLTTSGNTLMLFFSMIAIAVHGIKESWEWLTISKTVINTVAVFLQICFLCHAARLRVPRGHRSQSYSGFRMVLLYLALCNFVTWIADSFIIFKDYERLTGTENEYFSHSQWVRMYSVTHPLTLFFRFYSFVIFVQIYFGT